MESLFTVNKLLLTAIVITLIVWVLQETLGRLRRIDCVCKQPQIAARMGIDAGFPLWLRVLSFLMLASWLVLGWAVYVKRDGDFALILTALVLLCGAVSLADRFVFQRRRARLLGTVAVQQALASVKVEDNRNALHDWAETDYVAAEYAKSFFPVLLVVLVLRSFLFEPFKIPSASMVPTLQVHDFILVNKFAYGLRLPVLGTKIFPVRDPQRGDVMVFFPPNDSRYFIKRVIGLPDDTIRLENNVLFINGARMDQTFLRVDDQDKEQPPLDVMVENLQPLEHLIQYYAEPTRQSNYQTVVPKGHYFMMGDNRDNSSDSRFWGMVPEENVVGQAVYVWMHWGSWLSLPSFARNGVIE
jgi:signal peptidase I